MTDQPPREWAPDDRVPDPVPDQLYAELRQRILDGRLERGKLPGEDDMAAAYGVSTWSLREALRRLQKEGLVERRMRRGTWVTYRRPEDQP